MGLDHGMTPELRAEMEAWIQGIVQPLCNYPDQVQVRSMGDRYSGTFYLETAPSDVRFVVGRGASTISSVQSLASARAGHHRSRVYVEYTTDLDMRRLGSDDQESVLGRSTTEEQPAILDDVGRCAFVRWMRGIVVPLCDYPEEVQLRFEGSQYSGTLYLDTHKDDVRFVVGKAAHVISSIRTLAKAWAGHHRVRIEVEYTTDLQQREIRNAGQRENYRQPQRAYRQVGNPTDFEDL